MKNASAQGQRSSRHVELEELYKTFQGRVACILWRNGVPAADLEDAVHEVFVKALTGKFVPFKPLKFWLIGIAKNVARARLRKEQSHRRKLAGLAQEPALGRDLEKQATAAELVDEITGRKPHLIKFAQLKAKGLTAPEIAEATGTSTRTVYRRFRALKRCAAAVVAGVLLATIKFGPPRTTEVLQEEVATQYEHRELECHGQVGPVASLHEDSEFDANGPEYCVAPPRLTEPRIQQFLELNASNALICEKDVAACCEDANWTVDELRYLSHCCEDAHSAVSRAHGLSLQRQAWHHGILERLCAIAKSCDPGPGGDALTVDMNVMTDYSEAESGRSR